MKIKLTFLLTALLFVSIVKAQNVITVDNSVGANAQYNNLQTAISVASAGDIIYVQPSETTYGNVSINKSITIIGYGHLTPDKRTTVEDIVLGDGASNTKISGFYVNDDLFTSNTTVISNLIIENNYINSILGLGQASGSDNVVVRGNVINQMGNNTTSSSYNNYTNTIISNNVFLSYLALKSYLSITVKNNIFIRSNSTWPIANLNSNLGNITVQNNIVVYDYYQDRSPNSAGVFFENCLIYNYGGGNVTLPVGNNNLYNQDPLFVATNDAGYSFYSQIDDYHLQAGSPAKGTGAGGVDMGIYDGTFNFSNYGYTNGVPTVSIDDITDKVAPGDNISVTISTNANAN